MCSSRLGHGSSSVRGGFANSSSSVGGSSGGCVGSVSSGFAHGSSSVGGSSGSRIGSFSSGFNNRRFFLLGASRESQRESNRAQSKFDFHRIDTPESG